MDLLIVYLKKANFKIHFHLFAVHSRIKLQQLTTISGSRHWAEKFPEICSNLLGKFKNFPSVHCIETLIFQA